MGLRVNTNVQSLAAQRHLGNTSRATKATLEHLASGSRISRAADDSAGLAISEKMRAQVRSISQNIRNANDGISLIQTAEGAMNEISNVLIRFRELSIQAASDTVGDAERKFIDKEVQQLKQEIDRIAFATEFNGTKLIANEGGTLEIQIGQKNNPEQDRFLIDLAKTTSTLGRLGLNDISTASKESAQGNLDMIDSAINVLSENRSELGAMQNRLQASVQNLQIYNENLSAARSRIYDVDMATESSELVKNNILSQAGAAVLSQANQNSTLALKLI